MQRHESLRRRTRGCAAAPCRVRIKGLNGTTKVIPEPGGFQPALTLKAYPVPDPDDGTVHLEMAFAIARETIERARVRSGMGYRSWRCDRGSVA